ncbi:WHG domain-containing protein [Paraburkholderia sp. 22B1P]|uniref:TetR/AcrR family transcriptional regulator n=1 Tax=Paraburkholderia sp. 22B1P TaxID=3080498 RepID=UPI00308847E4|nr:TetR/AcrR family transcriptional regulator [Paraburkholderia sp. 22B1P]
MKVDIERIRNEASALANQKGIDGLSMNDLAAALGIRPPSLYAHVDGIGAVRRLLALHGLRELEQGVARLTAGKSGPDAVRALMNGYRNYARKNPGVYGAMLPKAPESDPEWREAMDRLVQTLLASLQGYRLEGPDAIHVLRGMRSLVHGFVSLESSRNHSHPVSRDASFAWLVDAFLRMLEPFEVRPGSKR